MILESTRSLLDIKTLQRIARDVELHGSVLIEPSVVIVADGLGTLAWNADVPYYPACIIKIPICVAAYELIERGELKDREITVDEEQVTESVFQSELGPGVTVPFETLVHHALYSSDNTAGNVLMDFAGRERATELLQEMGLRNTAIRRRLVGTSVKPDPLASGRNSHSPGDAAKLLHFLSENRFPYSEKVLSHLSHSAHPELGFFGLNPVDKLFYKDGYTSSVIHISSIVEIPDVGRYVCVVYSNLPFSPDNYARVVGFHRGIRRIFAGYDWVSRPTQIASSQ